MALALGEDYGWDEVVNRKRAMSPMERASRVALGLSSGVRSVFVFVWLPLEMRRAMKEGMMTDGMQVMHHLEMEKRAGSTATLDKTDAMHC